MIGYLLLLLFIALAPLLLGLIHFVLFFVYLYMFYKIVKYNKNNLYGRVAMAICVHDMFQDWSIDFGSALTAAGSEGEQGSIDYTDYVETNATTTTVRYKCCVKGI